MFREDTNLRRLLGLVSELPERLPPEIHAFVPMNIHYHPQLWCREANLGGGWCVPGAKSNLRKRTGISSVPLKIACTLGCELAGSLLDESFSGGAVSGLSLSSGYDGFLRRNTLNFKNGSTTLASTTYGNANAFRRSSVTDGTHSATYRCLGELARAGRVPGAHRLTPTTAKQRVPDDYPQAGKGGQ